MPGGSEIERAIAATSQLVADAGVGGVNAVGVDAVDIGEFEEDMRIGEDAFLGQIFTPSELEHCAGDIEKLAARFALKEAALKALGTGIRGIGLLDVEVRTHPGGQPELKLSPAAKAVARSRRLGLLHCSATHESALALAVVVASNPTALEDV